MCVLPLSCLKVFVGFGSLLSIAISLGMLALTVYANVEKKDIIENIGGNLLTDALVGLYLGSALFMVLGICGLYGAIQVRKNSKKAGKCLLALYFIGVIMFFAIFVGGSVFFFVGPQAIFGTSCKKGSKTNLVEEIYLLNQKADNLFCSDTCPCYVKNSTSELAIWLKGNGFNTTDTMTKYVNYQSCDEKEEKNPNVLLMAALEQLLSCTGWCKGDPNRFLKYTDINNCADKKCMDRQLTKYQTCYVAFEEFLTGKGRLVGFGCMIATAVCLLNIITICCICFHPTKTKKDNFYQRMMEDD